MEAKDTVMDELEMRVVLNKASWQSPTIPFSYHSAIAKAQAEVTYPIAFKAGQQNGLSLEMQGEAYCQGVLTGIWEVVEWVKESGDTSLYTQSGEYTDEWQAILKKWGIE